MKNLKTYNSSINKMMKRVRLIAIGVTFFVTACGQKEDNHYKKIYTTVQIESGDTLYSIARGEMNEDVYSDINDYIAEVQEINQLPNDTIIEGQYITIPRIVLEEELSSEQEDSFVNIAYFVEAGDTLNDIAHTFGDSVEAICERNSISKTDLLEQGMKIVVETTKDRQRMYEFELSKKEDSSIKYR